MVLQDEHVLILHTLIICLLMSLMTLDREPFVLNGERRLHFFHPGNIFLRRHIPLSRTQPEGKANTLGRPCGQLLRILDLFNSGWMEGGGELAKKWQHSVVVLSAICCVVGEWCGICSSLWPLSGLSSLGDICSSWSSPLHVHSHPLFWHHVQLNPSFSY